MKTILHTLLLSFLLFIIQCASISKGVKLIESFEKDKYLGKWYEIARMDFYFERGLINVTANYSLNDNGTIKVLNRGFNPNTKEWKEAVGVAKFLDDQKKAMLKVSFFGPFYAGYNVIAIDPEYKYALVCGEKFDYLWILSRETIVPDTIKKEYLKIAEDYGFKTKELVWVEHTVK
ncbi:MAG: lipocalin family protein [Leptospiraceae bacterium]|nr:lipocalin family protein [Leptospiraceae bacterium]